MWKLVLSRWQKAGSIIGGWDARVGNECGRCGLLLLTGGHRNTGCNFGAVCGRATAKAVGRKLRIVSFVAEHWWQVKAQSQLSRGFSEVAQRKKVLYGRQHLERVPESTWPWVFVELWQSLSLDFLRRQNTLRGQQLIPCDEPLKNDTDLGKSSLKKCSRTAETFRQQPHLLNLPTRHTTAKFSKSVTWFPWGNPSINNWVPRGVWPR